MDGALLHSRRHPVPRLLLGAIVARLLLGRLSVTATLRDPSIEDRLAGEQLRLQMDWDLAGAALTIDLPAAAPVDRDHDYFLDLALTLHVSDKLFDDISWHQLQRQGDLIVVDAAHNASAAETLTSHLGASELQITLRRND